MKPSWNPAQRNWPPDRRPETLVPGRKQRDIVFRINAFREHAERVARAGGD